MEEKIRQGRKQREKGKKEEEGWGMIEGENICKMEITHYTEQFESIGPNPNKCQSSAD